MMTRFIEVFRELGQATELLKTQVNLILVKRLQQNWTKVSSAQQARLPFTLSGCPREQKLELWCKQTSPVCSWQDHAIMCQHSFFARASPTSS